MGRQKRYYYIRVVVNGRKYRSQGFCNKSDFTYHIEHSLQHPFHYCTGCDRIDPQNYEMVYSLEFWRADGHNGNHYFLGQINSIHPKYTRIPLGVLYIPSQPIRFYKEEMRDSLAVYAKMSFDKNLKRDVIVVGRDKVRLPLGIH